MPHAASGNNGPENDRIKAKAANIKAAIKEHELSLKHPLENTWTLWYLESDRTKTWEEMQNEITSFDTVEDFWSLYNHIKPPSEIKLGSDYSLFKKGVRPMWEDPANKFGGRWVIAINNNFKINIDKLWLDLVLCLIGEAFDSTDQVCGAVINVRGNINKISDGSNKAANLEIGNKLKQILHLPPLFLHYQLHSARQDSFKSIYTLLLSSNYGAKNELQKKCFIAFADFLTD